MSETNGQAVKTGYLEPTAGYVAAQFCARRRTKGGLELARELDLKMGDTVVATVLAAGPDKHELGSVIESPCETGATILFPAGCGFKATDFLRYERGADLPQDEHVILLKFEDVLCTVYDE